MLVVVFAAAAAIATPADDVDATIALVATAERKVMEIARAGMIGETKTLSETVREALISGALPPDISPAALALSLCRTVADRFLPVLLAVEKRLEEMEEEMEMRT